MASRQFLNILLLNEFEEANIRAQRTYNNRKDLFRLSDRAFRKLFRLTIKLTQYLVEVLSPFLQQQKWANDLDATTKVLIALRFYATGCYQMNVATDKFYCVSQSSISRSIREVTTALNNADIFSRFVKFPLTFEELNNIRTRFYEKCNFSGIIGIIDCTHIAIVTPDRNDEQHPEHFYVNRKSYHSLSVHLICHEKLKIIHVNASFPGSTHDSFIWNPSVVSRVIINIYRAGHEGYYLLGDSGYPLRPWLMTPIDRNPREGTPEFVYNAGFRSIRCLIKDRVLNYTPSIAGQIVNACAVLHNLCNDHNIPEAPDVDLPEHPDFGRYPLEPQNNMDQVVGRINLGLVAGRRLRTRIMRN